MYVTSIVLNRIEVLAECFYISESSVPVLKRIIQNWFIQFRSPNFRLVQALLEGLGDIDLPVYRKTQIRKESNRKNKTKT